MIADEIFYLHRDIFGNPIRVGDYVLYGAATASARKLKFGKVIDCDHTENFSLAPGSVNTITAKLIVKTPRGKRLSTVRDVRNAFVVPKELVPQHIREAVEK